MTIRKKSSHATMLDYEPKQTLNSTKQYLSWGSASLGFGIVVAIGGGLLMIMNVSWIAQGWIVATCGIAAVLATGTAIGAMFTPHGKAMGLVGIALSGLGLIVMSIFAHA